MEHKSVRTSVDIPVQLHRQLHKLAQRSGCSARQLILRSIEKEIESESPGQEHRTKLPLIPAGGRKIRPVTNDEALFS